MANNYNDWMSWLVQTKSLKDLWELQPTYLPVQCLFLFAGFATLVHAFSKGGRWPWLWLTIVVHGLITDNIWHFVLPDMDNFWHSQTPVMLLGARLPLHIILLYPAFNYTACVAIARLSLPIWSEAFAVGLLTVLIDIPYDIVSVKFVHWTWHDTDPNIYDRHYWVPWNSYYFHATFAASLVLLFHGFRKFMAPKVEKWDSAGFLIEFKAFFLTAMLAMAGGVLMFIALYHPLHDLYGIHSEVTFFIMASVFMMFTVCGLMEERVKSSSLGKMDYILMFYLASHYLLFLWMVIFAHPENEVSVGLHEPLGPCNEMTTLTTPFGSVLPKRKYLCVQDYDEKYFDFHCAPKQKLVGGTSWYTICGTPFENRAEYVAVISAICSFAFGLFYKIFFLLPVNSLAVKHIPKKKRN